MEKYLGTKMIEAEPMTRGAFNAVKGVNIPVSDSCYSDMGYMVVYEDGYKSWSPKDVFEKAYRRIRINCMTFGLAIEAMRANQRVCRKGWNGKGMWLRIVVPGGDRKENDMGMENLPYIEMKTADNKLVPWLASQTDVLAEDWQVREE